MEKTIKISIDYHGVLTENPLFFKKFNTMAIGCGYEIYIVSGGHQKDIEEFVDTHQIPYTRIWSVVDHFERLKLVQYYPDGSFYVSDKLWNKAKAEYCLKNQISCHIDDSWLYGKYFDTPFCLYNGRKKNCLFTKTEKTLSINFRLKPEKVLKDLVELMSVVRL